MLTCCFWSIIWLLYIFSTFRTQNVISLCKKATAHQGDGALLTVKTIAVPLTLLKGYVFCSSKPTYGGSTSSTFLGIQVAEAVQTISKFISRSKSLSRQRFLASCTKKAFFMPGLISVGDTSSGDGFFCTGCSALQTAFHSMAHKSSGSP